MNLNDLNREQRLAAETRRAAFVLAAGAGSGKTRALTYRVANLLEHGVPPWAIWRSPSPTRRRRRCGSALKNWRARGRRTSGFRRSTPAARKFCAATSKNWATRSFTIYDDDDQMSALKEILKKAEHRRQVLAAQRDQGQRFPMRKTSCSARRTGFRRARETIEANSFTTSIRRMRKS